jgi:hypothetical protein
MFNTKSPWHSSPRFKNQPDFIWNHKRLWIAKAILCKKSNTE